MFVYKLSFFKLYLIDYYYDYYYDYYDYDYYYDLGLLISEEQSNVRV